jgi:hypothetical protein
MALHDATGGEEEGYILWCIWSVSCSTKYDDDDQLKAWNSFKGRYNPITVSTLFKLAIENGWRDTSGSHVPTVENRPLERLTIQRQPGDLVSIVMDALPRRFEEYEHFPSKAHYEGLEQIAVTIQGMADQDKALGQNLYVSFVPPGMGKTTTMIEAVST